MALTQDLVQMSSSRIGQSQVIAIRPAEDVEVASGKGKRELHDAQGRDYCQMRRTK